MRINKLSSLIGLSAALLLCPLTAAAQRQGPGIYGGVSWGAYSIKQDGSAGSELNKHEQVIKGVIGGMFNNWIGIEGSWIDFNKADNNADHFKADGKGLSLVLAAPIGTLSSAFVKAGRFWWDADSTLGVSTGSRDRGNDLFWGGGIKVGLNNYLALRVEYERYEVRAAHLNAVTGGVEFKF
jgi:OmpA-OmpF porin, OOP family